MVDSGESKRFPQALLDWGSGHEVAQLGQKRRLVFWRTAHLPAPQSGGDNRGGDSIGLGHFLDLL